jgi:hypothetical protein
MRISLEACRDPDLLAAEVRRLQAVIAAGEPKLTDEERAAILTAADLLIGSKPAVILRKLLERTK